MAEPTRERQRRAGILKDKPTASLPGMSHFLRAHGRDFVPQIIITTYLSRLLSLRGMTPCIDIPV